MDYDQEKLDEVVLALLHLTAFDYHGVTRAWKGFDWSVMERLHEKGLISDPRSRARSVMLLEGAPELAEKLFRKHFARGDAPPDPDGR